jgi:hypothetical protein
MREKISQLRNEWKLRSTKHQSNIALQNRRLRIFLKHLFCHGFCAFVAVTEICNFGGALGADIKNPCRGFIFLQIDLYQGRDVGLDYLSPTVIRVCGEGSLAVTFDKHRP